jgi:hypothetical protein
VFMGTGIAYSAALIDRVAEPEGIATLVFGQAVVALGLGMDYLVRMAASSAGHHTSMVPVRG